MKIKNIKTYPSMLIVEHNVGDNTEIDFDGCQGEFTTEEWKEDFQKYSENDQQKILDALSNTCNVDFFAEVEK